MDKLAEFLDKQMHRLQLVKEKPSYEELRIKHLRSIRLCDSLIQADKRIERQRQWLRSNLNASPEVKSKVKNRIKETKEIRSNLVEQYSQLQLP